MSIRGCTLLAALVLAGAAHAQAPCTPNSDHGKSVGGKALASPAATASATLAGKAVSITYNAPSMRCRTIMGDIVPYGKVWRTGANPATTLTTATALKVGSLSLAAGTYTLYTLPAAEGSPWLLIVNRQTGQWGTVYDQAQDLGRTPMLSKAVAVPQEVMSISFEDVHGRHAELHIRWEKTDVFVHVEAQ